MNKLISKIFFCLFLFFSVAFAKQENSSKKTDVSSFIIEEKPKKNNKSKNALKEDLASTMKAIVDECAFISATLGEILGIIGRKTNQSMKNKNKSDLNTLSCLQKLASINEISSNPLREIGIIQQNCSKKVEQLIENKSPFKNAGRGFLNKALEVNKKALDSLRGKSKLIVNLKSQAVAEKNIEKVLALVEADFKKGFAGVSSIRLGLV